VVSADLKIASRLLRKLKTDLPRAPTDNQPIINADGTCLTDCIVPGKSPSEIKLGFN
jgi:hypothetical protein